MSVAIRSKLAVVWRESRGLVLFLVLMVIFRGAIADWNLVPSGSMRPTILEGDRIWVNKLAYDFKLPFTSVAVASWRQPKRGDIIVFRSPEDGIRLVKRLVAIPGDVVAMSDNRLQINSLPVEYEPDVGGSILRDLEEGRNSALVLRESIDAQTHDVQITTRYYARLSSFPPLEVPSGKYFVLGDNRDNSRDSRFFGFVDSGDIIGRVSTVVVSLDGNNYYLPRSGRFLYHLD